MNSRGLPKKTGTKDTVAQTDPVEERVIEDIQNMGFARNEVRVSPKEAGKPVNRAPVMGASDRAESSPVIANVTPMKEVIVVSKELQFGDIPQRFSWWDEVEIVGTVSKSKAQITESISRKSPPKAADLKAPPVMPVKPVAEASFA